MSHRPATLAEIIGQDDARNQLMVEVVASRKQSKPLPHLILSGPAGTGKTTLSLCLANEMRTLFTRLNGTTLDVPTIQKVLVATRGVILIDEAHALNKDVATLLLIALEQGILDITADGQPHTIKLPPFTMIMATTDAEKLPGPLRQRCIELVLTLYTVAELSAIIANAYGFPASACEAIASRGRGVPRISLELADWCDRFAVAYDREVSPELVTEALRLRKVDDAGLTELDRKYINTLKTVFSGGPVGGGALANALGVSLKQVEQLEAYLLVSGLIRRTTRGRMIA